MDLKIIKRGEEHLLSIIKVESEIVFEKATPSREEIKSKLAKDLGKDEKLIVVKGIYTGYGLKKAKNISYAYENEEFLKRIEAEKKEKAGKRKEAKKEKAEEKPQEQAKKEESKGAKQEEKPKEGKPEEKPKETTKPEVKQEQKK